MGLDLLISDDGLQQADLNRDMNVCVVDGKRGLGNGHLLPAGPLREPAGRLRQVDYVVTNGVWEDKPDDLAVSVMQVTGDSLCALDDSSVMSAAQFRQNNTGKRFMLSPVLVILNASSICSNHCRLWRQTMRFRITTAFVLKILSWQNPAQLLS